MSQYLNPLAVILVTSGTRGNKLLFRYPYTQDDAKSKPKCKPDVKNPFVIGNREKLSSKDEKKDKYKTGIKTFIKNAQFIGFDDQTLANFLSVTNKLCGNKFSVEIDDVRFVGYPMSLLHLSKSREANVQSTQSSSAKQHNILSVNVVFVVRATVPESVVNCYQELAKQITVAIAHEEERCQYLTKEAKIMLTILEEASVTKEEDTLAPMRIIVQCSRLGGELKSVYDSLMNSNHVLFHLNQWVEINFCLPHKIHAVQTPGININLEHIYRCLSYVRPYHGILLTKSKKDLLNFLPLDSSPCMGRIIKLTSPLKNLITLALDTDLSMTQIYQLVCQMVYWGFAMLIYPLCQANRYVLSPSANTAVTSALCCGFSNKFPRLRLLNEMSQFAFPICVVDIVQSITNFDQIEEFKQAVVWMLQHRLLNQVHTYVNLVPPRKKEKLSAHSDSSAKSANSSISSIQVVEEAYLSVLMEDLTAPSFDQTTSMSDVASINSEESNMTNPNAFMSHLSKSPPTGPIGGVTMAGDRVKASNRLQDSLLNELEPQIKEAILACPAAQNAEDLQLFARLCPYFNGKHHLEEMMYYESLHRSTLKALLDKFHEVLIICSHEDSAISFS